MDAKPTTPRKAKATKPKADQVPSEAFIFDYTGTKSELNATLAQFCLKGYTVRLNSLTRGNGTATPIYTALGLVTKEGN